MGGKSIKNNSGRLTQQQKLQDALNKKPTAQSLSRQGIPAEELNKIVNKLNPDKQRLIPPTLVSGKVKNGKHKRFKPANAIPSFANKIESRLISLPERDLYPVPEWFNSECHDEIDVSIIVPLYKSAEVIKRQIESWDLESYGLRTEIIYVDDACPLFSHTKIIPSWEKRKHEIKNPIGKIIVNKRNGGFGAACNIGASYAKGKYLIFLNADCFVTPNWIKPLYDLLNEDETIGIAGNMQLREDNRVDSLGSEWDWSSRTFLHVGRHSYKKEHIRAFHLTEIPAELLEPREVEMVTGACFIIPEKLFSRINGFDLNYRIAYWEDSDLNMRVRALGYSIFCQPNSRVYHLLSHSHSGSHQYMQANKQLFINTWVESNIIEGFLNDRRPAKKKLSVSSESIVIYTAITGDYDRLRQPPASVLNGVECVAFLENQSENSGVWKIRSPHNEYSDSNRNAKIHKILSHKYFPNKEYSLWIDGSVDIVFPFSINRLIEIYLSDADLAIFKHSERNCLYVEANICLRRNLDSPELIRKQIQKYTQEGYPDNAGLAEATIILRRHSDKIKQFNELWWEEIKNGSKRDQISFNYVAHKVGLKYNYFPGSLRKNNYLFKRNEHKKKR